MRNKITASKATMAEHKLDKIITRLTGRNNVGPAERATMAADLAGIREVLRSQRQLIGKVEA